MVEEAGEDTEGMAETVSQLQAKLKALTHGEVDIMIDADTYKNTTQILREMAAAWGEMTDAERSAALELMGGKRQANILASVITNFQTVEDVIETSSNSSGSAIAENEKVLDSIAGKTTKLTNAMQALWNKTLNSDLIKTFLDIALAIVKVVDSVGLLTTALAGAFVYFTAIKKNNPVTMFKDLSANMQNYGVALKQIKAIQSLNGLNGTTKLPTDKFNAQNINAYAAAVSNLTAKQQASALASAGLTQAQIQEAMAANKVDQANIQQAMSEANVATAKTTVVNATVAEALALTEEQTAKLSETASNWLLENSSKQLTLSLVQEAIEHGVITPKIGAEIIAKYNLAAANTTVATTTKAITASVKALLASNPIGWIMIGIGFITTFVSVIGNLQKSNEELIQQANEIKNAYKQEADTIQSNISTIQSLEEEFNQLSRGVDDYGNNISLATDDYKRYQEIVETLVGISPSLIEGYDAEGKALANKNSLLQKSIELMQEDQRLKIKEYLSNDNVKKITDGIKASLTESMNSIDFPNNLSWSGVKIFDDGTTKTGFVHQIPKYIGRAIGVQYDYVGGMDKYIQENSKLIEENIGKILNIASENFTDDSGQTWQALNADQIKSLETYLYSIIDATNEASNELRSMLQLVPQSEKGYYDLDKTTQQFLNQYANSFSITENTTEADIQAMQDKISEFTEFLIKKPEVETIIKIGYNLNAGQDENGKTLILSDYQKQVEDFKKKIQESKTTDDQKNILLSMFGLDDSDSMDNEVDSAVEHVKGLLKSSQQEVIDELEKKKSENNPHLAGIYSDQISEAKKDVDDFINSLSISDLFYIKYKISADPHSLTVEELEKKLFEFKKASGEGVISVKTYSELATSIEAINEVLSQTEEIIANNTEVTQEYKDSLTELGISEEDLSDCFYENNKLVVKNASRLKQLVSVAKANISTQTILARAQARLKYKELYKQLVSLTKGQLANAQANKVQINTLYQEMSAIQKTIAKYSLLEQQLSEVTKTYTEFEEAQTIDSDNDYMSKTEEMLVAAIQAYQTGELGTETAQVSIKALVPEVVLENEGTVEKKAKAAHDYLMETLNKYFVLDFDEDTGEIQSAEMKMGNMRKFIEDGLGNNVFAGTDWQHFEWSDTFLSGLEEAPDKLQYFADKMNITKEVALSAIQEINNHDIEWLNGDYGSLFDQIVPETLDSKLQATTSRLAELNVQLANGKITQEEFTRQVNELYGQLVMQKEAAVDTCKSFIDLNDKMDESQKKLEDYQKQLQSGTDENGNKLTDAQISVINDQYTKELQNYEGYLKQKSDLEKKYGPMTEYTVSVALESRGIDVDDINSELNKVKEDIDYTIESINKSFKDAQRGITVSINDDGKIEYKIADKASKQYRNKLRSQGILNEDDTINVEVLYSGLKPEQQAEIDNLKNLEDKQNLINYYLSMNGVDTVQTAIDKLTTTLNDIYELLAKSPIFSANVEPKTKTMLDGLLDKVSSWVGDHVANFVSYIKEKTQGGPSGSEPSTGPIKVNGTAHATGNFGLSSSEHNALVGELGAELVVNPHTGRYYTVGDNGAEMVDLPKGAIIFNHKQTEDLLKNGYVTSRGKMLSNGTAYSEGNAHVTLYPQETVNSQSAADSASDAVDKFEEIFDWIEVRLEEINEKLDLKDAQLENATNSSSKNNIIDEMIGINEDKLANLKAGEKKYSDYAAKLLNKIPEQYRDAAQNGAIAISEFAGEADEATVKAIENYREWAQKAANLDQEIQTTITDIRELAIQKVENARNSGDVKATIEESQNTKLQNAIDLDEARGNVTSPEYYVEMMKNSKQKISILKQTRDEMQQEFDNAVESGQIKKYSDEWYEALDTLYQIDTEINEETENVETYQNAINEIKWDNFDNLIDRIEYAEDETQSLIDIMEKSGADLFTKPDDKEYWGADDVNWTDEGLTSLGLYAQQMETAEFKARQYAEAINDLEEDYKNGKYSESEYLEKLNELKSGQSDAIKSYYEAQDAIVDLNKARVDAIKEGIEKEIDAYEELISKKKEELSAEKDLHDFQKSTMAQQKNIADIQRKLAALSGDNSASAIAQRKKLEAELAEADAELEESYYDRSVENNQNALDQELKDFQDKKNAEIEQWDQYLENVEQVMTDSLNVVQANATNIYDTLKTKADEYNLTLSDTILTPWKDGALAIDDYQKTFGETMSSTTDQLEAMKQKWQDAIDHMVQSNSSKINNINKENNNHEKAKPKSASSSNNNKNNNNKTNKNSEKSITVGGKINAGSAKIYSSVGGTAYNQYFSSDPIYTVLEDLGEYLKVRWHKASSGVTGFFKKSDVKAYAKGSKNIDKDQIALLHELGEELVLHAGKNGKIEYLTKGSGVVPADLTKRLMNLAMNYQDILDRNRPAIAPNKSIVNNEISINVSYGDILHIEEFNGDDPNEIAKIVAKQFEKNTRDLNNSLRKYVR